MLHLRKNKQAERSEASSTCFSLSPLSLLHIRIFFAQFGQFFICLLRFAQFSTSSLPRYLCTKGKAKRNGSCLQNIPTEQDLLTRRKCILHKPAVLPLAPLTSAHQLPIAACRQLGSSSFSFSSISCRFFLGTLNSSFRLACLS